MRDPRTHRVTATAAPDGADLYVEGYARHLLADLINLLADTPELREDLDRLLDTEAPAADRYLVDVPSPQDRFIGDVVNALSEAALAIRVQGPALDRLAGTLAHISRQQGGRPFGAIPPQREGGQAA